MNRTYDDVLDRVTFRCCRLASKRATARTATTSSPLEEVRYAIGCGYTMITPDCSEHIRGEAASMSGMELEALRPLPCRAGAGISRPFVPAYGRRFRPVHPHHPAPSLPDLWRGHFLCQIDL